MTKKEFRELAINLSILAEIVSDNEAPPEEVANIAIDFTRTVLSENEKLRDAVGELLDTNDEKNWDRMINWLKFKKTLTEK